MRLAEDTITVRADNEEIYLRASLRAAMRLERQYGGFGPILRALLDGNLTVMAQVIREAAETPSQLPGFLETVDRMPIRSGFAGMRGAIIAFVCQLAGLDGNTKPTEGGSMSAADYHERLFKIATGWLGWTPDQAWDATPAEIMAAYEGRLEMLTALFGGGEKGKVENIPEEAGWATLKAMAASGQNRAS